MRDFAKQFYRSDAWEACRAAYLSKVGGLCELCKKRGVLEPAVIVHHKIHLTPENINDPRISLNFANLEALCRKCHGENHAKTVRRYFFDAMGNVISKGN